MKFAYLILVHKNPMQLKRLVSALDDKNATFIIHVDSKISIWNFIKRLNLPFKGRVYFTPNRENVRWGAFSMIKATMSLIDYFFTLEIEADYIHLISGQDYPVRSNKEFFNFFKKNKGKNFINYFSLPDKRWGNSLARIQYRWYVNKEESRRYSNLDYYSNNGRINCLPKGIKPFGGSQWWSLQYDCLKYIYNLYQNRGEIFRFYKFSLMQEYNLHVAQPSLAKSESYYTFKHTLWVARSIIRYTNFVEMMLPCFSKDALQKVLFTFNENTCGWGADYHWGKLINYENYNMAILDDVVVKHTRPIQSRNQRNINKLHDYMKRYKLDCKIRQIN